MTARIDFLVDLPVWRSVRSESAFHPGQRLLGWLDCSELPLRAPDRGFCHCSLLTPIGVGATPRGRPLPQPFQRMIAASASRFTEAEPCS